MQRVVPPTAQLKDATYALARQIADGPQIPIRMIKRLVYQSHASLDLRTHLDLVSSHMAVVRETADHKEGVQAFKDKRPPKFQGRYRTMRTIESASSTPIAMLKTSAGAGPAAGAAPWRRMPAIRGRSATPRGRTARRGRRTARPGSPPPR